MSDNFNIWPDHVIQTRNADGTSTKSDMYSLDAYRNLGFLGVIGVVILLALFSPIVGAFCLILYCVDISRNPIGLNVISLLASLYFLIDLHNGWLISQLVLLHYDLTDMPAFIYLNGGVILANIFLLLFGFSIYSNMSERLDPPPYDMEAPFKNRGKVFRLYSLIVIGVVLVCWFFSYIIFSTGIIKII